MKFFIFLSAALPLSASANTLIAEQRDLLNALKPCLKTPARLDIFPIASEYPKEDSHYTLEFNPTPLASDVFRYSITVYRAKKVAYITQFGGISGSNKTFGPVDINSPCPPPKKS